MRKTWVSFVCPFGRSALHANRIVLGNLFRVRLETGDASIIADVETLTADIGETFSCAVQTRPSPRYTVHSNEACAIT